MDKNKNLKLMDSLPTVDIKGKPYVMVFERIKHFRRIYPEGSIQTIIHHMDEHQVVMIARVYPDKKNNPQWFAEGVAQEYIGSGINKLSWAEVCNTSSIGRAMAMLGIGIEHSIASADEVRSVSYKQEYTITDNQKKTYQTLLSSKCFDGLRKDTNDWWRKLQTKEQADTALGVMEKRVDEYNKKSEV